MRYVLSREDPAVFVGTVEGAPSIDEVLADLEAGGYEKVWLRPFMSVAGDHAKNDMAGDEPDSWKSTLTEAGYDVEVVLKGTAEYPAFVDLWVNHLQGAMSHFE
jgi:sirohydrochlorin cobaltochelatase